MKKKLTTLINTCTHKCKKIKTSGGSESKIYYLLFWVSSFSLACVDEVPGEKASGNKLLLVIATDYTMSSSLSTINLQNNQPSNNLLALYKDSVVRQIDNIPYILEREGRDVIKRLGPKNNFKVTHEENVGTSYNPKDISKINNELGLMAFGDEKKLRFFNLNNLRLGQTIDISSYFDSNAVTLSDDLLRVGDFIYVSTSNSKYNSSAFMTSYYGSKLIKVDVSNPNNVRLASQQPPMISSYTNSGLFNPLQLFSSGGVNYIIVASAGYNNNSDGGIVRYNTNTNNFSAAPTKNDLGQFRVDHVVYVNDTRAFAITSNSSFKNTLIVFDPSDPSNANKRKQLLGLGTYPSMFFEKNDNKLFVADRNTQNPGVRIFNTNTLTQITQKPINVGLPPASMVVIER